VAKLSAVLLLAVPWKAAGKVGDGRDRQVERIDLMLGKVGDF
jgi:hypothetical protein